MVTSLTTMEGFPACPKCSNYESRVADGMVAKGFDITSIITLLLPILLQTLQGCGKKTPAEQAARLVANRTSVAARVRATNVVMEQNLGLSGRGVAALVDTVLANMNDADDMEALIVEMQNAASFEMM